MSYIPIDVLHDMDYLSEDKTLFLTNGFIINNNNINFNNEIDIINNIYKYLILYNNTSNSNIYITNFIKKILNFLIKNNIVFIIEKDSYIYYNKNTNYMRTKLYILINNIHSIRIEKCQNFNNNSIKYNLYYDNINNCDKTIIYNIFYENIFCFINNIKNKFYSKNRVSFSHYN